MKRFLKIEEVYHHSRPRPPKVLKDIVLQILQKSYLDLVIDLGCGTGISTNFWSNISRQVLGLDISDKMLAYAQNMDNQNNVKFLQSSSNNISSKSANADLLYVSQAIHWMNPLKTSDEVYRVLKKNGIYLALNANLNPLITPEIDILYTELWKQVNKVQHKLNIKNESKKWSFLDHMSHINELSKFNNLRKIKFSKKEKGSVERLVNLVNSIGMVNLLKQNGASDETLGIKRFKKEIRKIAPRSFDIYFFYEGFICQKAN